MELKQIRCKDNFSPREGKVVVRTIIAPLLFPFYPISSFTPFNVHSKYCYTYSGGFLRRPYR